MKTYKQLISEVAQPKAEDEIDFKDKHEIEFMDHPESEENQHTANDIKKAKRIADYDDQEDMEVYENASDEIRMMTRQLEFIKYAADEISDFLNDYDIDPEEWFQNKLTSVHTLIQGLHSYMEGEKRMMDRSYDDDMEYDMSNDSFVWEEKMTDAQMKRREEIVKGMKKNSADMKKRYGDTWKGVMYATATKMAMEEALQEAKMTDDHWVIVKKNGNFYSSNTEIKKIVRASTNPPSQKVIEAQGGDGAIRVGELRKKLKGMKNTSGLLGQLGEVRIYEKKLDKVNPDALKKDFDDREDKDIDNDGDVDDSDEYLHNRRQAIAKAMKESVGLDEAKMTGNYARVGYDYREEYYNITVYKNGKQVASDDGYFGANETGNPLIKKFVDVVKKAGLRPEGLPIVDDEGTKGVFKKNTFNWDKNESVELEEAAQSTWNVSIRKPFGAGGVTVKKGDSVEVKARNTSEAIIKAMEKMGISKKDGMGVSGDHFDLKKLKESLNLDEAFKAGSIKLNDGSTVKVNKDDAEALEALMKNLSSSSKSKMEKDMMKNKKEFEEILNFAIEAM